MAVVPTEEEAIRMHAQDVYQYVSAEDQRFFTDFQSRYLELLLTKQHHEMEQLVVQVRTSLETFAQATQSLQTDEWDDVLLHYEQVRVVFVSLKHCTDLARTHEKELASGIYWQSRARLASQHRYLKFLQKLSPAYARAQEAGIPVDDY